MHVLNHGYFTWNTITTSVLDLPKHEDLKVEQWQLPDLPQEFEERLADSNGQIADYGLGLDDGRAIHVKIYQGYYLIHWDERDPNRFPLEHLIYDAPH